MNAFILFSFQFCAVVYTTVMSMMLADWKSYRNVCSKMTFEQQMRFMRTMLIIFMLLY